MQGEFQAPTHKVDAREHYEQQGYAPRGPLPDVTSFQHRGATRSNTAILEAGSHQACAPAPVDSAAFHAQAMEFSDHHINPARRSPYCLDAEDFQLRIVQHSNVQVGSPRGSGAGRASHQRQASSQRQASGSRQPIAACTPGGFSSQNASIALSRDLSAQFVQGCQPLTYTDLAHSDLTALKAWNRSAEMMLEQARTTKGVQFHRRSANALALGLGGIQIKVPGTVPIGSWLAHPKTLCILDNYTTRQLSGKPCYLLPAHDVLVAYRPEVLTPAQAEAMTYWLEHYPSPVVASPLQVRHGFPVRVAALPVDQSNASGVYSQAC